MRLSSTYYTELVTTDDPLYREWLERAARIDIDRYLPVYVMRADDTTGDGEEFLAEELVIAGALGAAVAKNAKAADDAVVSVLANASRVTDKMDEAFAAANEVLRGSFDDRTATVVRTEVDRAMRGGVSAASAAASLIEDFPRRSDILEGMVSSSRYYTNNYYNRVVVPELYRAVNALIEDPDFDTAMALRVVREAQDARLKSVPYWRTVANGAASRSYHYGVLKAGQLSGKLGYQIVTVADERRSKICEALDGKTFWIADAADLIERVASAQDADIEHLAPWVPNAAEVEGLTASELVSKGYHVPPFHGNCRSSIRLVS